MNISSDQYNSLLIIAETLISIEKSNGKVITAENLADFVERATQSVPDFEVNFEIKKRLREDLEYKFKITHSRGYSLFDNYECVRDWYTSGSYIDYYWGRYKKYLQDSTSIGPSSISLLENKTLPDIMNALGNPNDKLDSPRLRRGLIIGDVQSGKTATYTGLICKAADAGYKVVILLAGITESLRTQTQERIDEGIVGISANGDRVGVGRDNKSLQVASYTSTLNDFKGNHDKISTSLASHKSLVIFVVKKNVRILTKLFDWLKDHNIDPIKNHIDAPMLLIDDEADNASVNTKNDNLDPTKTNKIIRDICNLFNNSTYVGFTATPFANVFIDPESVDLMQQADLFPEHFIYTLPVPSNYIGAKDIFFEDGKCHDSIRYITDIEEPDYTSPEYITNRNALDSGAFYYKHQKSWKGILPNSLRESILCFYLANAIRDLRGDGSKPRSMLVNMSRFTNVQKYIQEYIQELQEKIVATIRYDFSDTTEKNKNLPLFQEFQTIWNNHFSNIKDTITFNRVIEKHTLLNAIEPIQILVVNSSQNSGKLNYKANPHMRVIAVGGLALSRGLTLEGLVISYFYRNTATFDVLMQMGRWFGYRPHYNDICQIWTSQTSALWYAEIAKASEELKNDVQNMCEQRLTPKDFGLKVRDDSQELEITAKNKMRSAENLCMQSTFYGNIYDTPYISYNAKLNTTNLEQVQSLCNILLKNEYPFRFADVGKYDDSMVCDNNNGKSRFFENVPKSVVVDFLSKVKISPVNMQYNVQRILDFIYNPNTKGIDYWDIVFEGGDSDISYPINGIEFIKCLSRTITQSSSKSVIQISSRRRMLGLREGKFALTEKEIKNVEEQCRDSWRRDPKTAKTAETKDIPLKAYFEYLPRRKPILIIALTSPIDENHSEENVSKFIKELQGNPIVAFAIGFPGLNNCYNQKNYKVTKGYMEKIKEEIDDEAEIIEDYDE